MHLVSNTDRKALTQELRHRPELLPLPPLGYKNVYAILSCLIQILRRQN